MGEPRKTYLGERYFPLIIQNIHRYFLYLAIVFIFLLSYDAWLGMWFTDAGGKAHFGIGVGTLVLTLNALFLAMYTFGCHSLRHLVGGFLDSKSKAPDLRQGLRLRELPEPAPHDVGVDQPVLGGLHGCLHPPLRDRASARLRFL